MDIFIEYMVKKQSSGKETLLKIAYVLLAVVILIASFVLGPLLGPFAMIGTLVGFGAVFGAWYLITSMNVEYEYIITNGEMDVDKVIARRRRKRLITANARKFEAFGIFREAEHTTQDYSNRVYACIAPDAPGTYYAVFNHASLGKTLMVFSPNDRVLEGLRSYIPRQAGQVGGSTVPGNRLNAN